MRRRSAFAEGHLSAARYRDVSVGLFIVRRRKKGPRAMRGGLIRRVSADGERPIRRPLELEHAPQSDLVEGPVRGPADRAVRSADRAVLRLVVLIDQGEIDVLECLVLNTSIEVFVRQQ